MLPTIDFWIGVRLAAFANLRVTRRNWVTLWEADRSAGRFAAANDLLEYLMEAGELRRVFEAEIERIGAPDAPGRLPMKVLERQYGRGLRGFVRGVRQLLRNSATSPWPREGRRGRWVSREAFTSVHAKTRERLWTICCGAALDSLVADLQRHSVLTLQALSPRGSITKYTRFELSQGGMRDLETHLDYLFIRTGVAGLWPYFVQCATCGRFEIQRKRVKGSPNFCSGNCRDRHHQPERRQKRHRLRQGQTQEIVGRLADLQRRRTPDALEQVRREFDLTPRALSRLLRGGGEG